MKPKLLILELWGLGDLAIGTPFIQAATQQYEVTLLAKPFARELQPRFWPGVNVISFDAPWTVFRHKYHVWRWPLRDMARLRRELAGQAFAAGVSARPDPRDHFWLKLIGVPRRLGYPRTGSQCLLTDSLERPGVAAHRYEYWRRLGQQLGIHVPAREAQPVTVRPPQGCLIVHSGARLPARVWPLANFQKLVHRLRAAGWPVKLMADANQAERWQQAGETPVIPRTIASLCDELQTGDVFIGNDSGPGHVAAILGLPTFTLFGPSMPEWFVTIHPQAEFVEGPACPFRPCADYCHFNEPRCLTGLGVETVWNRLLPFLDKRVSGNVPQPTSGPGMIHLNNGTLTR